VERPASAAAWVEVCTAADRPDGLAPLTVTGGTGFYWEPNVWILHEE